MFGKILDFICARLCPAENPIELAVTHPIRFSTGRRLVQIHVIIGYSTAFYKIRDFICTSRRSAETVLDSLSLVQYGFLQDEDSCKYSPVFYKKL